MHIVGILACSGMTYPFCATDFINIIHRLSDSFTLVIVDNRLPCDYNKIIEGKVHVIGSCDTLHEFTCLNTGLAYIKTHSIVCDSCILATSALMNKPNEHIQMFTRQHYEIFMKSDYEVCGLLDSFREKLDNIDISQWIRTNFVLLKAHVLDNINFSMPFHNFKKIESKMLEQKTHEWLNKHESYKTASSEVISTRIKCIQYEKLFTAVLMHLNVKIMDMRSIQQ